MEGRAQPQSEVPVQEVTESTDWETASAGRCGHTCGIRASLVEVDEEEVEQHTLWCWGHGSNFSWSDTSTPLAVGVDTEWKEISSGAWHICGLREVDETVLAFCMGRNSYGCREPVLVEHPRAWVSISTGTRQTCAIDTANRLYCWGAEPSTEAGGAPALVSTPREVL